MTYFFSLSADLAHYFHTFLFRFFNGKKLLKLGLRYITLRKACDFQPW